MLLFFSFGARAEMKDHDLPPIRLINGLAAQLNGIVDQGLIKERQWYIDWSAAASAAEASGEAVELNERDGL